MTHQATADATAQTIRIGRGRHEGPDAGACVMELASLLAGEPFSDHPRAACPVIGAYLRTVNDLVDSWDRQRLRPYAARAVGTAGGRHARRDRAALCARYVARARRRPAWTAPVVWTAGWGRVAAREALLRGGVDGALALCDRLIAAGPHHAEPGIAAPATTRAADRPLAGA
jgi:hypothetical protein